MGLSGNGNPPVLVRVTRGGLTESRHRGSITVVNTSGSVIKSIGDPEESVFLRSAAKPIQTLPVIETGAADRFGLTPAEIAVMCGSLNGQDFQVAAVSSILDKIGLDASVLDCGIHRPSHRPTAQAMSRSGESPTELHNNCAGKHAAMLVLCKHHDWAVEGYIESVHPVQKMILERVAEATEVAVEDIGRASMAAVSRFLPSHLKIWRMLTPGWPEPCRPKVVKKRPEMIPWEDSCQPCWTIRK